MAGYPKTGIHETMVTIPIGMDCRGKLPSIPLDFTSTQDAQSVPDRSYSGISTPTDWPYGGLKGSK